MSGILGQISPGVSLQDVYTCPPNTIATVKVIVANRSTATTFRILVAIDGEATDPKQYLAFDTPVAANEPGSSVSFVISSGDVVRVRSGTSDVSFTVTGEERAEN